MMFSFKEEAESSTNFAQKKLAVKVALTMNQMEKEGVGVYMYIGPIFSKISFFRF